MHKLFRRVLSVEAVTPSEVSMILHMIRKPNTIIVLVLKALPSFRRVTNPLVHQRKIGI